MYKKSLFPIHIYQNRIKENDLIRDEVFDKIQKIHSKNNLEKPQGWLTDKLFTSFNYQDLNLEIFTNTKTIDLYHEYIYKFFDLETKIEIDDLWFNHYTDGDFQEVHTHLGNNVFQPSATFSCIHFLSFNPEIHSPVIFVDPNEHIRYSSLEMNSNGYNNRYIPSITEGDIFMFPSYLQHYVPKSPPTPDDPRITVAFNIRVIQYGDQTRRGN